MIPPPTTSSRSGTRSRFSASVESMPSRPGSGIALDPVAMIAWSKVISVPSTSSALGPVKRPLPRTTSTLRWRARPARPLGRRALGAGGEPVDDRLLPRPQRLEVDLRLAEAHAELARLARLGDDARD